MFILHVSCTLGSSDADKKQSKNKDSQSLTSWTSWFTKVFTEVTQGADKRKQRLAKYESRSSSEPTPMFLKDDKVFTEVTQGADKHKQRLAKYESGSSSEPTPMFLKDDKVFSYLQGADKRKQRLAKYESGSFKEDVPAWMTDDGAFEEHKLGALVQNVSAKWKDNGKTTKFEIEDSSEARKKIKDLMKATVDPVSVFEKWVEAAKKQDKEFDATKSFSPKRIRRSKSRRERAIEKRRENELVVALSTGKGSRNQKYEVRLTYENDKAVPQHNDKTHTYTPGDGTNTKYGHYRAKLAHKQRRVNGRTVTPMLLIFHEEGSLKCWVRTKTRKGVCMQYLLKPGNSKFTGDVDGEKFEVLLKSTPMKRGEPEIHDFKFSK